MIDLRTYTELTRRAADAVATDGGELHRVEITEAADGSRRWLALVDTYTAGLDQRYRITTPAPAHAPAWARARHADWTTEVRMGDGWLRLEEVVD